MTKNGETVTFTEDELKAFLMETRKSILHDLMRTTGLDDFGISGDEGVTEATIHERVENSGMSLPELLKRAKIAVRVTPIVAGVDFALTSVFHELFATDEQRAEDHKRREEARAEILGTVVAY